MADDDVQYELKTVQAIRGTEGRAIAKWQKEGWELVSQDKGTLRTEITFRRRPNKMPWRLIAIAGGVAAVLIAASVVLFGEEPDSANAGPAAPPAATQPVPEESASTLPAPAEMSPSQEATQTTEAASPAEEPVLTVENNEDLAALLTLTNFCSDAVADFASQYQGQTIAFDANIGAMMLHGGYTTRYDILIGAGDYSATSSPGPAFQFKDVNTTSDLHFTDPNYPGTLGRGDHLRITAEVDEYEDASCLFRLVPVSTEFR